MSDIILEAKNIRKSYGRKEVLRDVSFRIEAGSCIGVLGINGCGKSTLLAVLAGVLKPDGGSIYYMGKDTAKHRDIISRGIGYVPQENPLIEELSVRDNLRLWYEGSSKEFKNELDNRIAGQFGLQEILSVAVRKLSGGMKKRLSLASALFKEPKVMILDEPTAALDLIYKKEIHEYLRSYLAKGGCVILTTHEESDFSLCNQTYILKDGVLSKTAPGLTTDELTKEFI